MCIQNLTFGFHTDLIKFISLPRIMFIRFRNANYNLKKIKRGLAHFISTSSLVWCKNTEQSEVCYYSPILC